jgi:hypothetical protein
VASPGQERSATLQTEADQGNRAEVLETVLAAGEQLQVGRRVVEPVPINMVDDLVRAQWAGHDPFHDTAVEPALATVLADDDVAQFVNAAATPRAFAAGRRRWGRAVAEIRFEYRAEIGGDGRPRRP